MISSGAQRCRRAANAGWCASVFLIGLPPEHPIYQKTRRCQDPTLPLGADAVVTSMHSLYPESRRRGITPASSRCVIRRQSIWRLCSRRFGCSSAWSNRSGRMRALGRPNSSCCTSLSTKRWDWRLRPNPAFSPLGAAMNIGPSFLVGPPQGVELASFTEASPTFSDPFDPPPTGPGASDHDELPDDRLAIVMAGLIEDCQAAGAPFWGATSPTRWPGPESLRKWPVWPTWATSTRWPSDSSMPFWQRPKGGRPGWA
jgi:hypothetical protein